MELKEALEMHPLMLTRSSAALTVAGEWSLEELQTHFEVEGTESEVLWAIAGKGVALFKRGDVYISFVPIKE